MAAMQLTTARLLLREFVEEDWEAVLAYQSDPLYLRYYPWTERDEAGAREFVGWFLAQQQEQPRSKFQLAAVLKAEGWLIGNCGVRVNDPDLREGNIGYELDSRCWGQGYATEAAREMVRFGFEELGLHRIWSWCVAENVGSARVLEKVGMRQEGYLREKEYFKGRWWDQRQFAILDHEWQALGE
jgi:RimJ/RimL family protein N-acetyltransferase